MHGIAEFTAREDELWRHHYRHGVSGGAVRERALQRGRHARTATRTTRAIAGAEDKAMMVDSDTDTQALGDGKEICGRDAQRRPRCADDGRCPCSSWCVGFATGEDGGRSDGGCRCCSHETRRQEPGGIQQVPGREVHQWPRCEDDGRCSCSSWCVGFGWIHPSTDWTLNSLKIEKKTRRGLLRKLTDEAKSPNAGEERYTLRVRELYTRVQAVKFGSDPERAEPDRLLVRPPSHARSLLALHSIGCIRVGSASVITPSTFLMRQEGNI